ncbi:peroxidase-related enzyme [Pseudotabrizicola sp. L79]|uniref:peroxidase-related enzyme n=1 Tax=Pseudotabrizicola sp. L79 TaxID=3118402 RepID=UPI002F93568F
MTKDISRFPVVGLENLPTDLADRIATIAEKSGFVPNVFLAMAHRPDELRAFMDYHDALMEKPGGLTKAEREMIVVATSAANDCQYCVVAHGAILRIRAKNPLIADQVAVNWRKADLTPREAAMLRYALKVALRAQEIEPADHSALAEAGFTQDEIWDIGAITAFFGLSNRIVNMATIRPNDEFYSLGRNLPIKD